MKNSKNYQETPQLLSEEHFTEDETATYDTAKPKNSKSELSSLDSDLRQIDGDT